MHIVGLAHPTSSGGVEMPGESQPPPVWTSHTTPLAHYGTCEARKQSRRGDPLGGFAVCTGGEKRLPIARRAATGHGGEDGRSLFCRFLTAAPAHWHALAANLFPAGTFARHGDRSEHRQQCRWLRVSAAPSVYLLPAGAPTQSTR